MRIIEVKGMGRRAKSFDGIPLRSERLVLRVLNSCDADEVARLVSDPDVAKQTKSLNTPYSAEAALEWIETYTNVASKLRLILGIEDVETGKLLGTISLHVRRRLIRKVGILGYWIGRPYWANGFGYEAVRSFLPHCDKVFGLKTIEAKVFDDNEASRRVLERNGFQVARRRRTYVPERGGWRVIYTYRRKPAP